MGLSKFTRGERFVYEPIPKAEFDEVIEPSFVSEAESDEPDEEISELDDALESLDETEDEPRRVIVASLETVGTVDDTDLRPPAVAAVVPLNGFTRMQLVVAVIETLRQANVPKKAIELVPLLRQTSQFRGVVRKDVNSVLHGVLLRQGLANVDSSHRWRLLFKPGESVE